MEKEVWNPQIQATAYRVRHWRQATRQQDVAMPRAVVIAPDGKPMRWCRGRTAEVAILKFLPTLSYWPWAQANGYRIHWFAPRSSPKLDPDAWLP